MTPRVPDEGFVYIESDGLVARFPKVHPDAEMDLILQRTLRVPDAWFDYYDDDLPAAGDASDVIEARDIQDIDAARGRLGTGAGGTIEPREIRGLRPVRPPRRSRHPRPVVRAYWTVHRLFRP